jgi:hypothetical protein
MKKILVTAKQAKLLQTLKESSPKKANAKKLVKITKEQYNRIFANGVINESIGPIAKQFKKEFGTPDLRNMGENIQAEAVELLKYFYRKSPEMSKFWESKGLTYDAICENLAKQGIIINKNGRCELSKALGEPKVAMERYVSALTEMIGQGVTEDSDNLPAGAQNDPRAPWNQNDNFTEPRIAKNQTFKVIAMNREIAILADQQGALYSFYFYDLDKSDLMDYASVEITGAERDEDGDISYDYSDDFDIDADVIENYVNDNLNTIPKGDGLDAWEDGVLLAKIDPELKADLMRLYDHPKVDAEVHKVLSNINEMNDYGDEGSQAHFDSLMGGMKNKITSPQRSAAPSGETEEERMARLKAVIAKRRADSDAISKQMGVGETTGAASSGAFVAPMSFKKPMTESGSPEYTHYAVRKADNKIVNGWDYSSLYDPETRAYDNVSVKEYTKGDLMDMFPESKPAEFKVVTTKFLKNNGIDPMDSNNWFKYDAVNETLTTAGAGNFQYDANALPGISRDGSFKKTKKTKAQTKTQWAGGSFVDINECSECTPDNITLTKTTDNINAPSLGKG